MSLQTTYPVIKGLCRTCLAKEIELLSVFDYKTSNTRLDSVIASITGIKIKQEDGLPTTICKDCKEKATKAYDFKIHAQKSQNKLAKILKKGSDDILRDEEFTIDVDQKDVKVEQFIPDNQDEEDFDISLPFDGTEDSYETDNVIKTEVKCEMDSSKENVKVNVVFDDESEKNSSYCPVCNQNFPDVDTLTDHAWTVHADLMGPRKRGRKKKLTSTFLHKLTENGLNLKQDKNPKQKCIFCISTFRTKDDLVSHVPEHKDEKIFSCMLCKMLYLTKKDFERHKCLEQHNNLEVLSDPELEDKRKEIRKHELYTEMRLQELFKKNIAEHRQPGLVTVCNSCGGLFGSEDQFNRHRDREHPELSVRCQLCDKVFATLKSASRHRSACERVERLFACSSCEMRFTHEVTLNKHILRVHTGQSVSLQFLDREHGPQNYKCETCSRTFASKALLERHTRSHKTGEKVFECDTCKKKFTRRENLRQHMRIHEGKTYTEGSGSLCLYCGRSFANSSNYIVHMRRHTGEKPYKCDFCGKGFCRSSDLQCHRRSHTGEKPCVCRECGKAFSRSNKLTRHMRVHTGVKPYKCTYCEKAFAQSNDLTLHVRRHTGDKPYVCELCGDRFIQGTALHAHRRSHGHYPPPAPPQQPPLTYTI